MWSTGETFNDTIARHKYNRAATDDPGATSEFSSYEQVNRLIAPKPLPIMPCHIRQPFSRNENFTGQRRVLDEIHKELSPLRADRRSDGSAELRTFSICGFGGLGKTQIALQYTYEHDNSGEKDAFDAIFVLQADTKNKLAQSFMNIAQGLGLVDPNIEIDQVIIRGRVLDWLRTPNSITSSESQNDFLANWLLVFDNLDDHSVVTDWHELMELTNGSVLVTSRDPVTKSFLTLNRGIDLDPMTIDDCSELIKTLTPKADRDELEQSTKELAKRIGCLPLAAEQMAALIQQRSMTAPEFLKFYVQNLIRELDEIKDLPPTARYQKTLSKVWDFKALEAPALHLINILSLLDPDGIAESILECDHAHITLQGFPEQGPAFIDARTYLTRRSLVKRDTEHRTLSLHRLVQEVGRERMSDRERESYFDFAVHLLHSAWPFRPDRFTREAFQNADADKVLPHVLALQPRYDSWSGASFSMERRRQYVDLLADSAWYLVQRVEYDSAQPIFEQCLQICEAHPSELEEVLAHTLFAYARYGEEINLDRTEVFNSCKKYHDICQKLHNACPGDPMTLEALATSHTSYAQGYLLMDKYEEAIYHCTQCINLEGKRDVVQNGKEFPQFAHIHLAWALYSQGKYNLARDAVQKVVAYRERTYGPKDLDSPKAGFALQLLGMCQEKLDQHNISHHTLLDAYHNLVGTLSPKSVRVGQVCLKLAEHYARIPQPEAASDYFAEACDIFESQPYYKPELARAYFKRACFYDGLMAATGARSLDASPFEKAHDLYRKLCPEFPADSSPSAEDYDRLVVFWSR